MMFSGGNEANIQAAQKTLTSALIGLVIILCSYLIVNTIFWILAQISHTNYDFQWYKIEMNCEKVVNSNNQGNGNGDGGGDGQDGGLNEYGTYCNLKQVLGYGCHLESNCDYSKGPSIDHADCPPEGPEGGWACCIPKEGVTDPPIPTPPEPDQGGPCEGGKLMTLCKNYSECVEYPECIKKLHPEYPKSYCSTGDIMTCPNSCLHECTLLEDGTSIGCD